VYLLPTNGCICEACGWIDVQSDADAILNQDSVKAVKDTNEMYYCGRKLRIVIVVQMKGGVYLGMGIVIMPLVG